MTVFFVGAGPGDPELLTLKAHRLLSQAQCCVYAGSLVNPAVVAVCPPDCELHDSAEMSLEQITAVFLKCHQAGIDVVRLHTGDPSIYGAINEQMEKLEELGIGYAVVPGVSSFQAAAAAICTELTAPDVSQTIILSRVAGRTPVPAGQELEKLAATHATLCLFLSVHTLAESARTLAAAYGDHCPAVVVYRASWPDQRIINGTLAEIAEKVAAAGVQKTAMVLVGHALRHRGTASKLYDATFTHEFRQGVPV